MSGDLTFGQKKHRDFFDKLVEDEEIRAQYEANPLEVLNRFGIGFDPGNPPKPGKLPDPEALRAARDRILKAADDHGGIHADLSYGRSFGLSCIEGGGDE